MKEYQEKSLFESDAKTLREKRCLQCERELKKQNTAMREMLERIKDGFVALDVAWEIVFVNTQAEKMFSIGREEYEGKSFWKVFPELTGTILHDQYQNAASEKVQVHFECYFAPLARWFELSAYTSENGLSVFFRDVTEKRRVEEELHKLSLIATNSQNMIVFTDAERRITWVNDAFTQKTGYSLNEAVGRNPGKLLQGPDSDFEAVKYMREQIFKGEPFRTEVINYTKNKEKYWAEVYGQSVLDKDKNIQQYFAISTDITDRKQLQEQLLQEQKKWQKMITAASIKAQENERANVGLELHDNVNQVLTTVKLYLELSISGHELSRELMKKSMRLVEESIDEIRSLSKRLSAPSLGNIKLKDSLQELINSVAVSNTITFSFEATDLDLLEVERDLHLAIYRILQEHLTNILKHSAAQNVQVVLDIDEGDLLMKVKDDGKGFDTKKKSGGIGFTNMIARTESLNGSISINSAPEQGCELIVRFPLKKC